MIAIKGDAEVIRKDFEGKKEYEGRKIVGVVEFIEPADDHGIVAGAVIALNFFPANGMLWIDSLDNRYSFFSNTDPGQEEEVIRQIVADIRGKAGRLCSALPQFLVFTKTLERVHKY